MDSAIAGTVTSFVELAELFRDCIDILEGISYAAHFGDNQEILQIKAEVQWVRLLVWGQSVGISTIIDDWCDDLDVDEALLKEYLRSAVASLLVCFIKIFQDAESLEKDYGLVKKNATSGLVIAAANNSSESPVIASVFPDTFGHFQSEAGKIHDRIPEKLKATWMIVDKRRFRVLIDELKGVNDSLSCLLPGVQQKIRVQIRSEIMRSDSEQHLQSLVNASENLHDFFSETASLRLEMLSSKTSSRNPADQATHTRAIPPLSASSAQINLPQRPHYTQTKGKPLSNSSRSAPVVSEPVKIPFDNTGALVIRDLFSKGGRLSCSTGLVGIEDAPELSKIKPRSHPSMEYMFVPESLYPILSKLIEMDIESDPGYAGWAPASVSLLGFCQEFTQWNTVDPVLTEIPWARASSPKAVPLQTIVGRWKEITKYGLGQDWTEEKGREQVNEILGPSESTWIDPNENSKIRHQISDLLGSLSRENAFPNLQMQSSIGMLVMNDNINPNSNYHMIDFMYQMLQAKEISLRLLRDNRSWHGGITGKVLYDMVAAELWMRNLGESETGGFKVFKAVKDSQMRGIIHLAEELQWPYLSEVRELAQHILDNPTSGAQVDIRVWDWMMGLVLPGGSFALSAFLALHNMSWSIKYNPPAGTVKVRLPDYGFSFPGVTYWRSRSIVGRVLAPLSGVKDIAGWIGPCPAVSSPCSINGKLVDLQYLPPNFHQQDEPNEKAEESSSLSIPRNSDTLSVSTTTIATTTANWEEPIPPLPSKSPCKMQALRLTPVLSDFGPIPSRTYGAAPVKTPYLAHLDFQLFTAPYPMKTVTLYTNSIFISAPSCRRPTTSATESQSTEATQQEAASPQRRQNHRIDPKSTSLYSERRVLEIPDLMSDAELMPGVITVINATALGGEVLARAWCTEKGCNAVLWKAPREDEEDDKEEEGGEGGCFKCALMMASKEGLDVGVVICC